MARLQKTLCALIIFHAFPQYATALPYGLDWVVDGIKSTTLSSSFFYKRDGSGAAAVNSNASLQQSIWILEDTYQGKTFFDTWDFYNGSDPTHGLVNFTDADTARQLNLAYVKPDGTVIMQGDNSTWLAPGVNRNSVRIQSQKTYTGGLFILDLNQAPWGCGVWPAFWTLGAGVDWPQAGEIDIIEGVHDNSHNQVTWHTVAGCNLVNTGNFTGTVIGTDCDGNANGNAGCAITDWSKVSYGEDFDSQGGGMYAMKWDQTGISVWYFYRVALPQDIVDGVPDPSTWTTPSAYLSPEGCDLNKYFYNHQIVFDITFCGDWAGNTYSTNPACSGTCTDHLQDPSNFVNASWSINSLKAYRLQNVSVVATGGAQSIASPYSLTFTALSFFLALTAFIHAF